jgi:ATP-binding cassette subfamily B multidrug efflux pump
MKELLTLTPYLRRYTGKIFLGLFLVLAANVLSLASPYLIGEAIAGIEGPDADRSVILRYVVLILVTALAGGGARYWMRQLLNGVSRWVEFDLRNRLFDHLLRLDAAFYSRMQTGEIMSRATNDIAAVRMVAGPAYMYLANTVAVTILAVGLMLWIDPWLTLVAMIPMLALPPITIGFGRLIHDRFEAIQVRFGEMSTMVHENLAGVRIVKAYGQEARQIDLFEKQSTDYLERNLSLARVSGMFHPLLGLFSGFAMLCALLLGGRRVMEGTIDTGDFVAFMLYLGMLAWPMIALGWVVNLFQRGAASMRRINEILQTEPDIDDSSVAPSAGQAISGEIEFQSVSFKYPGSDRFVLRNVSFRIGAGESLAIVGPTGSGKSTLVNLMVRLYDPTEGIILLDGVPIREMSLDRLRGAIGIVPQDAFLFSETIGENLSIGIPDDEAEGARERIRNAIAVAQLSSTIEELPSGLQTMLGERGVNLSGGQKQRATLARAIARNPAVLILDDSLSAVDTHTETEILRGLRGVMAGRTTVLVSHRVSAVMGASLIIVLEDGEIVESGRHDDLIERDGPYARLLQRQLLEEAVQEDESLARPET